MAKYQFWENWAKLNLEISPSPDAKFTQSSNLWRKVQSIVLRTGLWTKKNGLWQTAIRNSAFKSLSLIIMLEPRRFSSFEELTLNSCAQKSCPMWRAWIRHRNIWHYITQYISLQKGAFEKMRVDGIQNEILPPSNLSKISTVKCLPSCAGGLCCWTNWQNMGLHTWQPGNLETWKPGNWKPGN